MASTYYWSWAISAAVLLVLAIYLGLKTQIKSVVGILVDARGRVSLTHLQLTLWTILILSLISGAFWGRLLSGVDQALNFAVPSEVLALMGISVGSAVAATITKSAKDNDPAASLRIAVPSVSDKPQLSQIFLLEEGEMADKVIDITKFQNFAFTIILVVAYLAVAIDTFRAATPTTPLAALPGLAPQFLTLLAISNAGYVAGKLPNQSGFPETSLADRNAKGVVARAAKDAAEPQPQQNEPKT